MRALVVAPHEHPVIEDLPDLRAMQKCVGGYIQAIYPWEDVPVALVCDEEGLYHDSEWNRYICKGVAIKGTFFICGIGEEDFEDLPDDLITRFEAQFREPEYFIRTPRGVAVINAKGPVAFI